MSFDIYSTRAQLKALELMPREYSFLYDTFGEEIGPVEDDKAIYDFKKGSRRMAPVVHPGQGGVLMPRDGYETREIGFATVAPERVIDMDNVNRRYFGEAVLGAMTPEERAKKMQAKDLQEMRAAIQRRREHMVRQVLLTGKLSLFEYTNEGRGLAPTVVADYSFTNTYTPSTAWSSASADINGDLQAMYDLVYDGLGAVDVIVLDPAAASAMLANGTFQKTLDMKNADMGEIRTKYRGQGVRFLGYNSDGVEMYSYSGKFVDDDGVVKPYLTSGTVIAGGRGCLKAVHGPVSQVESYGPDAQIKTYIKKEVPLRYGSIDGSAVKNRLTSRPTIVPFNVDGWCVSNVL